MVPCPLLGLLLQGEDMVILLKHTLIVSQTFYFFYIVIINPKCGHEASIPTPVLLIMPRLATSVYFCFDTLSATHPLTAVNFTNP